MKNQICMKVCHIVSVKITQEACCLDVRCAVNSVENGAALDVHDVHDDLAVEHCIFLGHGDFDNL